MFVSRRKPSLTVLFLIAGLATLLGASAASAASLHPSGSSLGRQNVVARELGLTFTETRDDVRQLVQRGQLVPVRPNEDFHFKEVSFPFALPAIRDFVQRTAKEYRATCGEELVVTSLARPRRLQPRNASRRSVHPAGMALDLRRSWDWRCRRWIEGYLLALESEGVLEATRERNPSHYHIAIYPRAYEAFVEWLDAAPREGRRHIVLRGDTLWKIAARYGTTIEAIRYANDLRSDRIHPGQVLDIPGTVTAERVSDAASGPVTTAR